MKSAELIGAIGPELLEGMIGVAPEAPEESEATRRFRGAYEARFGRLPALPFIDAGYDAAFLLALAIQLAGSTEGLKIRDALYQVAGPPGETILPGEWEKAKQLIANGLSIDYHGAAGSQDFDESGDVPGTFAVWRITDGQIHTERIVTP
jgi:branched-chain amino acid transport system substrate-binding protein